MRNFVYYLQARRRWESNNKTIEMMDGVANCPYMLLAQKEMLELEMEHHLALFTRTSTYILALVITSLSFYTLYFESEDVRLMMDNCYSFFKNKIGDFYGTLG
jgi:hypothetical protein